MNKEKFNNFISDFKKFFINLKVIFVHRWHVRNLAFRLGIPVNGLLHDLSKYSIKELSMYKYATGTRSPHQVAREELGYSPVHLYHKHRNKHHYEYWLDIESLESLEKIHYIQIPYNYIIEMVCDMVSTGKTYFGKVWTCEVPYRYYLDNFVDKKRMHEKSNQLLEMLLKKLASFNKLSDFVKWYRPIRKTLKKNYKEEI